MIETSQRVEDVLRPNPRVRVVRAGEPRQAGRCVLYWMQRAQRGRDNAALDLAIDLGNAAGLPVLASFALTADYPGAQRRHYRFLLEGLVDAEADLARRRVPLVVRIGAPDEVVPALALESEASFVVGDENPVRVARTWRDSVGRRLQVPFRLVDADVIVPSALFPKEEFAARTIRPKIHRVLADFLNPPANPVARRAWDLGAVPRGERVEPAVLLERLRVGGAGEIPGYRGGRREAMRRLARFVAERLPRYAAERNEPASAATSELSAHLHFGHIGPLTIARAVLDSDAPRQSVDAYIEELVVRRELAINFVARNSAYDQLSGCPAWALYTLARHAADPRPVVYSPQQLETADTGDPLWNAAQREMVLTGRMHNYLRMYWAKKLLEWRPTPESAFELAIDLNDRYEMDGRDPNGYTGVAWAIGGKHDRPWPERPIFGTVRFMSYESTRRKFDSRSYIERIDALGR